MKISQQLCLYFGVSILAIVFDQVTKNWASEALGDGSSYVIFSWFKFQLAHNYGAAFSFLGDASGWQRWMFSILAIIVSIILVIWIVKTVQRQEKGRWCELLALSLILGGAIGNVYDRILLGYVVDFIVWHYQDNYFPTFNIADSAICTGAGLMILDMLFLQKKEASADAGAEQAK